MRVRVAVRMPRPGFPWTSSTHPRAVARLPEQHTLGVDYDTRWARTFPARVARAAIVDGLMRPLVRALASPRVGGLDRLEALATPVIFAPNHHSHLDTPLLLTVVPERFRHRLVVAAGADYFFQTRVKAAAAALAMGAIPIERLKVSRRSADQAADLLDDGWSLLIFPEGGRSPDGWGQSFRAGAAYLSLRCDRAVVPVHVEGTGRILRKGARRVTRSTTTVTFGHALRASPGEDARRFAVRIEDAVAALADEAAAGWWDARRRAAAGTTPPLTGPSAPTWRRAWALGPGRADRRQRREWP